MNTPINYIIQKSLEGDKLYQELLLIELRPLIFYNIFKYYSPGDDIVEDLAQEGYMVILEGLLDYDKSRNAHFLEYIKIKIQFFYKNYFRNSEKQRQTESYDQKIEECHYEIGFEDIFISNNLSFEEKLIETEEIEEIFNNIKKLSIKEQDVLNLYFLEKLDMQEISDRLNISYRTAIGRKYTAIKRLKKMMANKSQR
jgi:RNA polymerase sporulation-specific sigma factor